MCMYYTKGINQDGYILCRQCNMKKYEHPIFIYIYNNTFQCDDIILLIQDYIKTNTYQSNQTIAGGCRHTMVLLQDNTIRCWGGNDCGQCYMPEEIQNKVVSIGCGNDYSCVVIQDKENISDNYVGGDTFRMWGSNKFYQRYGDFKWIQPDEIQNKIISVSCGNHFMCFLFDNNTIKCWGSNQNGICNVPDFIQGKVVFIRCNEYHIIALLNDGTVKCWGNNNEGQCNPPDSVQGRVESISCGLFFSCALLNDGTVICWGDDSCEQCNVPDSIQGKIISISSGSTHTVALLNNNTVKCWGNNGGNQCEPLDSIQGKIIAIECGLYHSIALLNNNTIACWGENFNRQCNVPNEVQGKIM